MVDTIQVTQHHGVAVEIQSADARVVVAETNVRHVPTQQQVLNEQADEGSVADDGNP